MLDSTVDILGDTLVLAPLIETIELFAKSMTKFTGNAKNPYRYTSSYDNSYNHANYNHENLHGKLFFYVFQNDKLMEAKPQKNNISGGDGFTTTKLIDQRLGSMPNDELDYLFGSPIAQHVTGHSIGHFKADWNKTDLEQQLQDIRLSQMMITYFSNFARFG